MRRIIALGIVATIIATACNNGKQNSNQTSNNSVVEFDGKVNSEGAIVADSNEYKVFTLPTPLQLPTILKLYGYEFNESFLAGLDNKYLSYNNFERAINTGIYGINLGYCTMYEQPKYSLNYFERVKILMNQDGYKVIIDDEKTVNFQKNIDNVDTLSKMILESYYDLHQQFQDKEEEGFGLLVLTGAFIEGLYMSTHNNDIPDVKRHFTIIAQQKIFLVNLINLLSYYSNSKDVSNLIIELTNLNKIFDEFEIGFDDNNGVITNTLNAETYEKIVFKIESIRNEIIKS